MTKGIAILVMVMGMSIGFASRVTRVTLAQAQDDKMQGDEKMDRNGEAMKKKNKSSKKDSMSHDKMGDDDKMGHPQQ